MKGTSPKKRTNRAMRRALAGFFVQFVQVACIITVAVFAGEAVDARFGENVAAKSAVMLVVVVFLALLATVVEHLRRKIAARPVERICAAAKQLAAGDFSVQLEPVHAYGAYDALDEAMEALNAVAAELRQADESRSGFISNVSHELKTPLAVIQSYASALPGAKDEATRAAYCETIVGAAKRLTALVQNVLRLNRLEHHGIRAEFASLRLDDRPLGRELPGDRLEQPALQRGQIYERRHDLCHAAAGRGQRRRHRVGHRLRHERGDGQAYL